MIGISKSDQSPSSVCYVHKVSPVLRILEFGPLEKYFLQIFRNSFSEREKV